MSDITIMKAMKLIPCEHEFERMWELSQDDMKEIVRTKPVFPYSREQIENMTKEKYRVVCAKWESIRYGVSKDESDKDTMYKKFREWNLKCLNEMYEDDMEHLSWLCDWIAKGKVRNMDMESTAAFHTAGIYFNAEKQLVVYNHC